MREGLSLYNFQDDNASLKQAILSLRSDFDTHNHDGSSSKMFETIRAEALSARSISIKKIGYGDNTAGLWAGMVDATLKMFLGDATNYLKWTGSALSISGELTASSGTIGGWIIGAGSLSSASSGERIVLNSTGKEIQLYNSSGDEVLTMFYGAATTAALLKLAPTSNARRALEIITEAGLGSDAEGITIDNNSDSISIDITDGGLYGLYIAACDTSAIKIASHSGTAAALDITSASDLPALEMTANGTGSNSYGIRITKDANATKDGIFLDINADSNVPVGIYIDRDANTTSATNAIGMRVDCNNANTGGADAIVANAKNTAVRIDSATTGVDTSPIGNTNSSFKVPIDNTAIATSTTDSTGRIKIMVGTNVRYIPYFS